jgi:DNA-directed RNA polymerase specialized sigma24 family protein
VRRTTVKEIYGKAYGPVCHFVSRNSGDAAQAKDILHQAWEVLEEKLSDPDFHLTTTPEAYLLGVAKNCWYKELRRRNRHRTIYREVPDLPTEEHPPAGRDGAVRRVMALLADAAFATCRDVLLHFYRGWSMEEIAEDKGFSGPDSAKSQKAKCLKKLRAVCLQDRVLRDLMGLDD